MGLIKEKDAAFYLLRAQIFYALNEFYLSNEDIKKGITLHPDNIQLYNLSALNYIAMFNIDKAKEVISNYEAKNGKKESFADIHIYSIHPFVIAVFGDMSKLIRQKYS